MKNSLFLILSLVIINSIQADVVMDTTWTTSELFACHDEMIMGDDGEIITDSGTVTDTIVAANGDVEIATTEVTIYPRTPDVITNVTVCENSSSIPSPGSTTAFDANGCPYQQILIVTVLAVSPTILNVEQYCENDPDAPLPGTYVQVATDANGCEYDIITDISYVPFPFPEYEQVTICEGEEYKGFTESGTYTIVETAEGCEFVGRLDLIVLPIEECNTSVEDTEAILNANLQVHPNPVSEMLTISFRHNETMKFNYWITDYTGRTISQSDHLKSDETTVEVSGLSSGIYLLNIESDGHTLSRRFIKQE